MTMRKEQEMKVENNDGRITEIRCSELTMKERKLLLKVFRSINRKRSHRGEEKMEYVMRNDNNINISRPM